MRFNLLQAVFNGMDELRGITICGNIEDTKFKRVLALQVPNVIVYNRKVSSELLLRVPKNYTKESEINNLFAVIDYLSYNSVSYDTEQFGAFTIEYIRMGEITINQNTGTEDTIVINIDYFIKRSL